MGGESPEQAEEVPEVPVQVEELLAELLQGGPDEEDIDRVTPWAIGAQWSNREMGSEMDVAQLLALKVFSSTFWGF